MPDDTPTAGLNESLFGHDLFGEPVRAARACETFELGDAAEER